ncbi:efflux RND transporter periplasmic adaptor subunit [Akkermansiaceae bacterium]|nr:efflux RND transporter periplasmic adaptor subunit [Akkermansiaceae bacterium]
MSLDDLKNTSSAPGNGSPPASTRKRSLSWLLPVGLLCGFLLIFGLLFGDRLIPATEVQTAPVITIRSGETNLEPDEPEEEIQPEKVVGKGQLLFQASGWVEPDPYTTHVPTLVNGVVNEVHALEGQAVNKGELLATLIDEDARLDVQTAQRNLESLRKKIVAHCTGFEVIEAEIQAARRTTEAITTQVDEVRDTYSRLNKLSAGSVSEQQVVQAQLAVDRQLAKLAEAEAEIPRLEAQQARLHSEKEAMVAQLEALNTSLARAQLALDRTKITSPMNGIVLQLHAAPGKKRMLGMDDPTSATIVELYDPAKLQARIDVPLNEAAALSAGQAVELVSDLLPDKMFEGVVTRITGQADLQRNTLQAKVEIKNPDIRLRPDMLMRAKFFAPGRSQKPGESASSSSGRLALYVPEEALISESQVWTISSDSRAEKRTIKLGKATRDGHRLVLEGLLSGESVILPPHDQLEEGSAVKVTNPQL